MRMHRPGWRSSAPTSRSPPPGATSSPGSAAGWSEPLIAILIVAALVSGATGDWAELRGHPRHRRRLRRAWTSTQEHRAEAAAEALKRSVAVQARVLRDGARARGAGRGRSCPATSCCSRAGDLVPADGVVLASRGAQANEALLTGEAYPVEKRAGPLPAPTAGGGLRRALRRHRAGHRRGDDAGGGDGRATRFGGIAAALRSRRPPTAFERGLARARAADPAADRLPGAVRAARAPRLAPARRSNPSSSPSRWRSG